MKHLVIGGAGFIGSNLAHTLLSQGDPVIILDNLSRLGSKKNLQWLRSLHPDFEFIEADIVIDQDQLNQAVKSANRVYHLAAQVAVTSSVIDPRRDFEINALGTFNVLEALRLFNPQATLIFASTNKVYGGMENVAFTESATRYSYRDFQGVSEDFPLNFHSPYGCSKGCGDQYVRDYSRIYGLNTIVFRQSCIYGPRQFGVEDQGWVAWFVIALITRQPITIYGDGKQVRDLLYVDDLIRAYQMAADNIKKTKGQIINLGGGPDNTISVYFDFKKLLEKLFEKDITASFAPARPGDQKIFVTNIAKAKKYFNWQPQINVETGLSNLYFWVKNNLSLFSHD